MLNLLKRMFVNNVDKNIFNRNLANNVIETMSVNNVQDKPETKEYVTIDLMSHGVGKSYLQEEKQDRCTFEYNAQYKVLRNVTMLFKQFLKETRLTDAQYRMVVHCIKAVRKDSDFIKNRLVEGTYDKNKGTDYEEEIVSLFASLKALRVIRKTMFYIYDNKCQDKTQTYIVSKLINILNVEINKKQEELDAIKNI
jgi:hypothetical protein